LSITGKIEPISGLEINSSISLANVSREVIDEDVNFTVNGFNNYKAFSQVGFANRISFKNYYLSADLLYRFNEYVRLVGTEFENKKSLSLQNMLIGAEFKFPSIGTFNFFGYSRNAILNTESTFYDQKKYFGIGVDWSPSKLN
jgi:hypothetical protein